VYLLVAATSWCFPTEEQEGSIGRKKLSKVELDDSVKSASAHNALTTIFKEGKQVKILHGRVGKGEFGTYFIGYSRSPRTLELMLESMFIGRRPGNYDRLWCDGRPVQKISPPLRIGVGTHVTESLPARLRRKGHDESHQFEVSR
jgi:hypothetical protein